ncbi:MAG: 50S ribosomal protein L4, partial [Candidatus Nitrosopelagicus sp.]|nr:50S ribosomal protein L4 [Candidatus Nitrosopelagicus sp.]
MKRTVLTINGKKDNDIELPNVFETEVNRTLIHRAFINLQTHGFQKHSTKPTAG